MARVCRKSVCNHPALKTNDKLFSRHKPLPLFSRMPRRLFVALLFFSPRLLSFFSKALPHTWKLEALTVAGVNQPSAALRNINKLQGREESRASPLLSNALIQTEVKEGKAGKFAVSKQPHLLSPCPVFVAQLAVHPEGSPGPTRSAGC